MSPTRIAQTIRLRPDAVEEYEHLHAHVWPAVLQQIHRSNIRNYSIWRHDNTLFAVFDYIGDDYAADMASMATDPVTQRWWALCQPLQQPFGDQGDENWWTDLPRVFHTA